jgi:hypothetical protein
MKFNYRVKHNGIVYQPGAEVPIVSNEKEVEKKVVEKVEVKPTKTENKKTKK